MAAEDIVQDAFLKAMDGNANYTGKGSLGGWVRRIAVNKAIDFIKKEKKVAFNLEGDIEQEEESSNDKWEGISIGDITQSIENLPDGYRTIMILHLIEEYSHEEIAARIGCSASNSRSQYLRARKKLQTQLENDRSIKA